jgi:sugar lactone lactonase YvrE
VNIPAGNGPEHGSLSTNGAMARGRLRRIALLVALSVLLAAAAYVAYYYSQNRRAPSLTFTAAAQTVQPLAYLYSFAGTGTHAMTQPTGVAIIGNRCYVTDYAFHTVRAYTVDGAYLFDFGAIKDGANTKLSSPVHLAVGPGNTIWVTDRGLKGLYVFDQDGKFVRKVMPNGDPSFQWSPLALAFGSDGNLYVTDVGDSAKHQVLVLAPDGTVKTHWGATKQVTNATDSPGDFYFPNGIVVKGAGKSALVFVSDGDNRRIQVFQTDGTFMQIFNTAGTPRGLALDPQGRLFVVDALAHRVDTYSDKGELLATFGENGTGPGQFNFPNDITFDARGRAFITDRDNNQVQVWGPLVGEIPGVTHVTPGTAWVPVALLLLIASPFVFLATRPRRFMATPDFIDGMIAADLVPKMVGKRWLWVVTEPVAKPYEASVVDGVALGTLLHGEPYSESDAQAIRARLGVDADTARLLAMAKRCRVLCTEDIELARLAVALGVDVYDRAAWLEHFGKKRP